MLTVGPQRGNCLTFSINYEETNVGKNREERIEDKVRKAARNQNISGPGPQSGSSQGIPLPVFLKCSEPLAFLPKVVILASSVASWQASPDHHTSQEAT